MADPTLNNIIDSLGVAHYDEIVETLYVNPIFPNNFIMNFYSGVLRYIASRVPRQIKYKMVTTYQKGIERLHKEYLNENGGDINSQQFPALILQPGAIKLDERINSTWHTMSVMSENIVRQRYEPYASIGDMKMWVVPNKFIVNFEVFYIGESYLEITDMFMHMNRLFNNRYVYINPIAQSQIMVPDQLVDKVTELYNMNLFELSNDFQLAIRLDYNRKQYAVPYNIGAHVKLLDSSDGSNYFGGAELPTYRINFSFEALLQLPNHLVVGYESNARALELTTSVQTPNDMVVDMDYLSKNFDEATLIHIYDDYPSEFTISFNRTNLKDNIFSEFYAILIDIDSGYTERLPDDDFEVTINENEFIFHLKNVPTNKVIDIIGKYSDNYKNNPDNQVDANTSPWPELIQ